MFFNYANTNEALTGHLNLFKGILKKDREANDVVLPRVKFQRVKDEAGGGGSIFQQCYIISFITT